MPDKVQWKDDKLCLVCEGCGKDFGVMRRRHHCRRCGGVFCDPCTSRRIKGVSGYGDSPVRVCAVCYEAETAMKRSARNVRLRERKVCLVCDDTQTRLIGDTFQRLCSVDWRGTEYSLQCTVVPTHESTFPVSSCINTRAVLLLIPSETLPKLPKHMEAVAERIEYCLVNPLFVVVVTATDPSNVARAADNNSDELQQLMVKTRARRSFRLTLSSPRELDELAKEVVSLMMEHGASQAAF